MGDLSLLLGLSLPEAFWPRASPKVGMVLTHPRLGARLTTTDECSSARMMTISSIREPMSGWAEVHVGGDDSEIVRT